MNATQIVTAGAWLPSVGDIATASATADFLAARRLATTRPVRADESSPCIVGGGHLLKGRQDAFGDVIRHCWPKGRHALNAVGAEPGDWSHLSEYAYVSVRDHRSAEHVARFSPEVVPCPSILMEPMAWQDVCKLPRHGVLKSLGFGNYVIVHEDPQLQHLCGRLPKPVLSVQPRIWCHERVPWRIRMLPLGQSPEVMLGILSVAKAVVTRSLHLGIFALACGVPFCCIDLGGDLQSIKVRTYWERAGIPEVMTNCSNPVDYALSLDIHWMSVRNDERKRAAQHLDNVIAALEFGVPTPQSGDHNHSSPPIRAPKTAYTASVPH